MPTDKFIIQFDTRTGAAVAALEQLARKVEEIERRMGGLTGAHMRVKRTGPSGGLLQFTRFTKEQLQGFTETVETEFGNFDRVSQKLIDRRNRLFADLAAAKQRGAPFTEIGGINRQLTDTLQKIGAAQQFLGQSSERTGKQLNGLARDMADVRSAGIKSLPVFDAQTTSLLRQRTALNSLVATHAAAGTRISRSKIQAAFEVNTQLAQRGFRDAARDARLLGAELDRTALASGRFTGAFGAHARRVAEGIILYQGFELAVRGAATALTLVAQTDREIDRLALVLGGLSDTQADAFLTGLGDIAVKTNTDFSALLATTDLVASALSNLPADQREAGILEFQSLAGQFSNLLGPGTNQETVTRQLVPIFKILGGNLDTFATFLDHVTVAANRNAFEVEGIVAAYAEAGTAVRAAGVDVDFFILLLDDLIKTSGQTPSEIGNLFKTVFGRILKSPDEIQDSLDAISDGFLQVRDSAGNIKEADTLLLEMIASMKQGVITAPQLKEAIASLTGPLAPGQVGFVDAIIKSLDVAIERSGEFNDATGALGVASKALTENIAAQFGIFVQKIIRGIVAFREELSGLLGIFLAIGSGFIELLGILGPGFGQVLGIALSLALALKAASAAIGIAVGIGKAIAAASLLSATGLTTLGVSTTGAAIGATALGSAAGGATTTVTTLGAAGNVAAGGVTRFGGAMVFATNVARGFVSTLGILLPLMAAFATIEFLGNVQAQEDALAVQLGQRAVGANATRLAELRASVAAERDRVQREEIGSRFAPGNNPVAGAFVRGALEDQLTEIDRLLGIVNEKGPGAVVVAEDLTEAFAAQDPTNVDDTTNSLLAEFEQIMRNVEAQAGMNDANREAASIAELNTSLADERVQSLETLNQRLGEGLITQQQYNEGQLQIARASELSSQLVARYGEQLGQIPILEAAAQGGVEGLTGALFQQIIQSGNNIGAIDQLITKLLGLASAHSAVSNFINQNPIIVRMITMIEPFTSLPGFFGSTFRQLQNRIAQQGAANTFNAFQGLAGQNQANTLMSQLSNLFNIGANNIFGTGPGGGSLPSGTTSTTAARQTTIVDIGDLSAASIGEIIAIATRLRDQIPGEAERSIDEVVALIKDAQFLQTVGGIDDRLLRLAMEELVEVEKDRLEQERQKAQTENILKSLVTNVGPLGALITQPTFAGVGGSLVGNNGLNFDPSAGNFVINVPVELNGLEPAKLQQLIYQTVAKAIQDAIRLGS
jgi:hypothetical protein